jgi:hypothetical protein
MRQSNRNRHNHKRAVPQRGVGTGYRGSYYGSDGYDEDPAMLDETVTSAEETRAARCGDISPGPPKQ